MQGRALTVIEQRNQWFKVIGELDAKLDTQHQLKRPMTHPIFHELKMERQAAAEELAKLGGVAPDRPWS